MQRGFIICGFIVKRMERSFRNGKGFYNLWVKGMGRCFEKKPLGLDLRPLKACYGRVMIGYDRDRGGPKEIATN